MRSLLVACGIYFPDQESNLSPSALAAQSLSHWTAREAPSLPSLKMEGGGHEPRNGGSPEKLETEEMDPTQNIQKDQSVASA